MATKKTGTSLDLIIHPGETIADILEERGITQNELAARTGVTPAFISNVLSGKKDISAKFAFALEYALGVPKSFWLNLQANYDAEILEAKEQETISEREYEAHSALTEVITYLKRKKRMPASEDKAASILSLRKALRISDISNLDAIIPAGAFRMSANSTINPYVLGAWIRLCQITGETRTVHSKFDVAKTESLISEIKSVMLNDSANIQHDLTALMGRFGIDFSVVKHFRGAPVQGYISLKQDGTYQMVLTIRGSFADIFWFSLFHELGHIVNGDVKTASNFIDYSVNSPAETAADLFAVNSLLNHDDFSIFLTKRDYSITAIQQFAKSQNVKPYIVIGRLQKEKFLKYNQYSNYKTRYKWAE